MRIKKKKNVDGVPTVTQKVVTVAAQVDTVAWIQSLAWEFLYAVVVVLKKQKRKSVLVVMVIQHHECNKDH